MKILRLELLAFGPFTDTALDLSAGEHGLHIIYGPNEAGKSSTLRAIHGLLYGIPPRTADTFRHDGPALRIGAILQNSDKSELHFHRRKGNKDTLLNPKTKTGGAYPKDTLNPFLGGIDQDTFERVYGITHEELQHGGDEMKSLRGLVGESLFAATIGGSGLASLLNNLESEASAIYHPRKHSSELKKAARAYKELQSEKRQHQLSKSRWEKLRSDLSKAEKRRDEVVGREQALAKELRGLQRIQNGLSLIGRRREVREKLAELGDAVVLPAHYSIEKRARAEANLKLASEKISRLNQQLDGDNSLRSQINSITIPDGLLEFEETINELKDRRAISLKAASDIRLLGRDCETLQAEAEGLLRDLGLSGSLSDAQQFRLTSEQRLLIQNLGSDERRLRDERARLKRAHELLVESLQETTRQLDQLGVPADLTELQRTLARVRKRGDLQAERDDARAALETQKHRLTQQLATLDLWSGTLTELTCLCLPLAETIDRFVDDFAACARDRRLIEEQISHLEVELLDTRKEIAALQTAGHVPTETELEQLRRDRDRQWQSLQKQFSAGKTPEESAATDYEAAVKDTDLVSDRLRREAERVAHLAERTAQQSRLQEQAQQLAAKNEQLIADDAALNSDWIATWQTVGIESPLRPKEMLAWSRRLEALQQDARLAGENELAVERLESRYADSKTELTTILRAQGVTVSAQADLAELLNLADEFLAADLSIVEQRHDLTKDIARLEKSIDTVARDEKQASDEFDAWQAKWKSGMRTLGCAEDSTAEQANDRMQSLARLFEITGKIAAQEKRIQDMTADSQQFECDVKRVAERFAGEQPAAADDGSEIAATDLALELHIQLEQARSSKARRHDLEDKLAATQLELSDAQAFEQTLIQELQQLCQLAGVQAIDDLPSVERASDEVAELQLRLHDLEEQLHHQSGNLTLDEFTAEAEACHADELPVRIETIERELKLLEAERDDAVSAVSELQRQTQAASGSDEAAQKDEQSLGLLSRMHRHAAQYMRLRLASTMLRKQIDEHRAENEDPLLERASGLFAQMTCGEYSGLRTDYENDEPVIVGVRNSNDELVAVPAMSDGTRDQLYLALRLGYVERQLIQYEPLPFIVDDILVQFDNDRSIATLEVLVELSRQTQVIFLTHHEHLIDLARNKLSDSDCFVHRIDSRNQFPGTTASAIAAKRPR